MSFKPGATSQDLGPSELAPDLQRELLDLQSRGARISNYELLGTDPSADRAAIRAAYMERSKRFHPDRYLSKKVGQFGPLLAEAFKRMTDAHSVLSDADKRAAYDAILSVNLDTVGKEAVKVRADARADEERRAAERRRRLFMTKGFARLGAARKLYEEALVHAEAGERSLAIEALKVARQLDPQRPEIQTRLLALEAEQRKIHAFALVEAGRAAEARGDFKAALSAYQGALRMDMGSAAATVGASRAALVMKDFDAASAWAARAVEYAPRAAEPRIILARAQMGLGQKAKAKATLQALLDFNPEHKEARALLKLV